MHACGRGFLRLLLLLAATLMLACSSNEPIEDGGQSILPWPRVDAMPIPDGSSVQTERLPRGRPVAVTVVRHDSREVLVDAPVLPVVLDPSGVLAPPAGIAGWYHEPGWPRPGEEGAAIIVGHVDTRDGPDTFAELPAARPGDAVHVRYSSNDSVDFVVRRSASMAKTDVPHDDTIWDVRDGRAVIRLITCDPESRPVNGHYGDNWVVWADRTTFAY
ncbi:class F sortase [Nocardioides kongjuensis]